MTAKLKRTDVLSACAVEKNKIVRLVIEASVENITTWKQYAKWKKFALSPSIYKLLSTPHQNSFKGITGFLIKKPKPYFISSSASHESRVEGVQLKRRNYPNRNLGEIEHTSPRYFTICRTY